MAERTKSFIPIIATKERILGISGTEIPQKEGQTFLTKDGKFSYFDKGGERFLSPKFGVIEKDPGNEFGVFLRDYASFKGSLIISRDEEAYKMFYVDTNGAVYELSSGGGGSSGGFSTNAMTLGGFGPDHYLDYSKFTGTPDLADVAISGDYNDLSNRPSIPAAQVQSNWNATTGMGAILNKPNLAAVATSGDYNDLTNKLLYIFEGSGNAITNVEMTTTPDSNNVLILDRSEVFLVADDIEGKEDESNKATNLTSPNDTKYPTTLAVVNAIDDAIEVLDNNKVDNAPIDGKVYAQQYGD